MQDIKQGFADGVT